MKVPLHDLNGQLKTNEKDLKEALSRVVDSTRYIGGPEVEGFEKQIADHLGAAHAIGVSSGTDALLLAMMGLEIGPGDLVVTTTYTFFATAGCIERLGAKPVFVDIDPDSYNLDPQLLVSWLDQHPEEAARVRAVVPVHLYGQCADLDPILEVACERGIAVIEDAAQAIGATYPGRQGTRCAGTLGLAGTFSFFPSKNLGALGDGGLVVTDDEAFAHRLRILRQHGAKPKYYHAMIGGNFRLDPIQAAALGVKLPHLAGWSQGRRERAAYYDANLDVDGLKKPVLAWGREHHIYHQYVVSVPGRRDELAAFLTEQGIGHAIYYPVPLHLQECFAYLGYRPGDLPCSEHAALHTLALPIYPELTPAMQDAVIARLEEFHA